MDALQGPRGQQAGNFSAEDLELLIAKYTLEYLWRWTNEFDPAILARIRVLLAKAETPQDIASAFRRLDGALPN
jgi:hypothetical protein